MSKHYEANPIYGPLDSETLAEKDQRIFDCYNRIADIVAQRDELLAALKDIADFGRSYGLTAENAVDGIRNKARHAIARVERGASNAEGRAQ